MISNSKQILIFISLIALCISAATAGSTGKATVIEQNVIDATHEQFETIADGPTSDYITTQTRVADLSNQFTIMTITEVVGQY